MTRKHNIYEAHNPASTVQVDLGISIAVYLDLTAWAKAQSLTIEEAIRASIISTITNPKDTDNGI